jgi:DNA modification methylase
MEVDMLKIDPEFKSLIPPLSKEEYQGLEKSIIQEGCRDAIITWDGIIVDGHNRYEICGRVGAEYNIVAKEFADREEVMDWMDANQLSRRNLSPDNFRLLLGRRYQRTKKKDAFKGNQYTKNGEAQNEPQQNTAEKLAAEHGVSPATVKRAGEFAQAHKQAQEEAKAKPAPPEPVINIEPTTEEPTPVPVAPPPPIAFNSEAELMKRAKEIENEKKQEKLKKKKAELEEKIRQNLEVKAKAGKPMVCKMDAITWLGKITPTDLLLTDPPYSTDVQDIANFAQSWLPLALSKVKPTGRAYVFVGAYPAELQAYLNAAMPTQILVWTYRNTLGPSPNMGYKLNWQAILYYQMPDAPKLDCPVMLEQFSVQDINAPDGRQGDRYHAWQKPLELAERLIRHSTKEGDTVIDPFCCTGTFPIAAAGLGRRGFGCDISDEHLDIAEQRGCDRA